MVLNQEKCMSRKKKMMQKITRDLNINYIKTNKFKTITLYFIYSNTYDFKEDMALHLLARFVGKYSKKYPTKNEMIRVKDNLYGVGMKGVHTPYNGASTMMVALSFINPRFIKDVTTSDYLNFFDECLNNTFFSEELLAEIKREMKLSILHKMDNPSSYSHNRVMQIIAQKDPSFLIYDKDISKYLDEVSLEDIKNVYHKMLKEYNLDIYAAGDFDNEFLDYINRHKRDNKEILVKNHILNIDKIDEIVENKNVSQSYLYSVYKVPYTRENLNSANALLALSVLGNSPTSLLFTHIREKLSLCYYINIEFDFNDGAAIIKTAIDKDKKDEVLKQIDIQISKLINQDYDLDNIDVVRNNILDAYNSLDDNFVDYFLIDYSRHINGATWTLEEFVETLSKLNADDLSECLKNCEHVFTYMLRGEKDA